MSAWQTGTITADPQRTLTGVARRVQEISSLPMVALRVMEVTNDPNARIADLKAVLESDASSSARVLRLVNSSAYGIRQRVTNLQVAISYLGFRQIRNLALTASISDVFKKDEQIGRYSRPALWRHLVSVGICSRMVAMRRGLENFEDVFLAGLLHDVGIILEDQYDHTNFRRMVSSLTGDLCLDEAERKELGYSHMELGTTIAEQWRFPELVTSAVRLHHHAVVPQGEYCQAVQCVQVANALCTLKDISSVGFRIVKPPVDAINGLNLQRTDIEALLIDFAEECQRHSMLFAL
jgi:putative nucleotidyltransferase with HDIG domain